MDWKKIVGYGACLSAAQVSIGFAIGFFSPNDTLSVGSLASLLVSTAIFAHLATRTEGRPYLHACLVLAVYGAVSLALASLFAPLLGSAPMILVVLEWLGLVASVFAGFAVGSVLRTKEASREA